MKYYIKTFGCQMNVHDSEKLAGMLQSLGYKEQADTTKDADIIVFNTCCIRDGVEQKIMGNIGALKKLKKSKPHLIIAICGCMSQAEGRSEMILSKFPFVDIIFGTHNIHALKDLILQYQEGNRRHIIDVWPEARGIYEDIEISRDGLFSNAWVNINYGCNNFCSYCIVPYVRGRERSRNMADIVSECRSIVADGYKYITLLGQNVNSYGNDIDDENINFANLLKEIASIPGDFRIKFMTSHPKDLTLDVIKVIAENEKICKCIHLPVQSGSNNILKLMNRKYTREHYLSVVENIRQFMPDAYISTDIIVGFPGETDEDFMDTYNLVKDVKYDGVFAFMFSKRSGTVAAKMDNQIDEDTKKDRIHKLLQLSKSVTKDNNKQSIGKIYNILTINHEDNNTIAQSDSGKTILIENSSLELNKFYKARIIRFANNKLIAEIIN
ncbi:MAG: tRNA (N6-isopentenyl adenosine(37)-C2)-methylthiotransferase MiaB [Clostridiales bacterium]|nr:tRNA (N6-isopentenyl adenosine(37)-C2)-methylthiotransferase MiaB [Clostridiales bacterium]